MRTTNRLKFLMLTVAITMTSINFAFASPPEQLWRAVERYANLTKINGTAIIDQWPGQILSQPIKKNGNIQLIKGGKFTISDNTVNAIESEIRVSDDGRVRLITIELDGMCVTQSDISNRYPANIVATYPQPNNPNPTTYRRIFLDGVRVSFGFRGNNPNCLRQLVFNPNEQGRFN